MTESLTLLHVDRLRLSGPTPPSTSSDWSKAAWGAADASMGGEEWEIELWEHNGHAHRCAVNVAQLVDADAVQDVLIQPLMAWCSESGTTQCT